MNWLRLARARLIGFFRKEELEGEIDEELRFHVAMRTEENIRRGMSRAEAAREARRQFGNVDQVKDQWRDVSGGGALESFVYDVRFAARMLLKDRAFTIVAVSALALGIGANTALFTVLSNVVLRPLPYPGAEAIMSIAPQNASIPGRLSPASYPDFLDLREQTRVFERMGAYRSATFIVRANEGEAVQVPGAWMTADVFPLLGAKPAVGRLFSRRDEEPGTRAVVISHQLWEKQFGKAASVIGVTLKVDGADFRVIGVMPAGFSFPIRNDPTQFWITLASELEANPEGWPSYVFRRGSHFLRVLGRLKPGFTEAEAHADVNAVAARLAEQYPETNSDYSSYVVTSWLDSVTQHVRPVLVMLLGAAAFALCVACANVANLLLARASTRRREIAVRAALGAGRRRILRQLLTESLLLATIGGLAGLLLALLATRYIVAALPHDFPRADAIAPNAEVLGFTLAVTMLTSCVFGLAPSWRSAQTKLAPLLNDASTGATDTPGGRYARNILVVAEIVLAFVLLAGACFFISNLMRLRAAPLGFDPQNVVTAHLGFPDGGRTDVGTQVLRFFDGVLARVSRLDGVESTSLVSRLPLSSDRTITDFEITGRPMAQPDRPLAEPHIVSPRYFETMRVPIVRGRDFNATDAPGGPPVAIINSTLAERFFPGQNPVGQRITPVMFIDTKGPAEREIIGVAGDVRTDMLAAEQRPQVYVPLAQCAWRENNLLVRSALPPDDLIREVETIVSELNDDVPVAAPSELAELVTGGIATPRLKSALLAAFAAVAVILTAIGVYGVIGYSVAQRRHEIGIRLALGAPEAAIFRLILSEGVRLTAFGILLGASSAAAMLPMLQKLAPQGASNHALVISLTALLLGFVALAACWIPARRAARQQPLVALGAQRSTSTAHAWRRSARHHHTEPIYEARRLTR